MTWYGSIFTKIANWIAKRLESQSSGYQPYTPSDQETLLRTLRPGDVLLVEGNQKISAAIKYLTQSTWSHAALFVGDAMVEGQSDKTAYSDVPRLIEVNLQDGCVAVPLSKYESFNTRICRPAGLDSNDRNKVTSFMISNLGVQYDLRNIMDLARYLIPTPPVPVRWRRRMISLGSGEPTKAICSTLIAQAFQSIRYPILPEVTRAPGRPCAKSRFSRREILHIRHHSLFAPRDFDLSPYFMIVKPTLEGGFDYRKIVWGDQVFQGDTEENAPCPEDGSQSFDNV